jgi:glutathione peroxidase
MFEKIDVNGPDRHPLYRELVAAQPEAKSESDTFRKKMAGYGVNPSDPADLLWNFEKFLVARDGRVVARFSPDVTVDSPLLSAAIAEELGSAVPR